MNRLGNGSIGYDGIDFAFVDMQQELQHLESLASAFLDPACHSVLKQFIVDLNNLRESRKKTQMRWEIEEKRPLVTIPSNQHDPNKRRAKAIKGEFSGVWTVSVPQQRKRRTFRLDGEASLHCRLRLADGDAILREWHADVATKGGPGCHLHLQLAEFNGVAIPRWPNVLITPGDALEFLLGEVFQKEWDRTVSLESDAARGWRSHQNDRLRRLFRWHDTELREKGRGWSHLRRAKPPVNLFVESKSA